jgi:hypothetical protein
LNFIKQKPNLHIMRLQEYFFHAFFKDMERWPLWCPVFLGSGIGVYFSLPFEPPLWTALSPLLLGSSAILLRKKLLLSYSLIGLTCFSLGFGTACLRTHLVSTDMLHYPLPPQAFEGRVQQVELRPTKEGVFYQRLLLTNLKASSPEKLPQTIRLSLKGKRERLWPGQTIHIKAKVNPIADPSLPGDLILEGRPILMVLEPQVLHSLSQRFTPTIPRGEIALKSIGKKSQLIS